MSDPALRDLEPLKDGEPVWGLMPSKLSDEKLVEMEDNCYDGAKGILLGVVLGTLLWGVVFFALWMGMFR